MVFLSSSKCYLNIDVCTIGTPCDELGNFLPSGAPPPPRPTAPADDFSPYQSREEFELAELLYSRVQMSAGNIDALLDIWASTLAKHNDNPLFANAKHMYETIDSTNLGDVKWESFTTSWQGELPENPPAWMTAKYDVWFRDPRAVVHSMLGNPDIDGEIDYAPSREFDGTTRRLKDFMSGDWAWNQAASDYTISLIILDLLLLHQDIIAENPDTHGAAFVPIVLGSDKTTVSIATGQTEYYPLYLSIGNIHNNVRRAHRDGVALIGFLAIPKSEY